MTGIFGSVAKGINDAGQVAGDVLGNGTSDAFLYSNGTATFLENLSGTNSSAQDINNAGQVVGYTYGTGNPFDTQAFLYHQGSLTNLNSLLDSTGKGWNLLGAIAINNNGQIVGEGLNPNGQRAGYLLSPAVPEPSTTLLLGLGLVGLAAWQWKRQSTTHT